MTSFTECFRCGGTGHYGFGTCRECNGSGMIEDEEDDRSEAAFESVIEAVQTPEIFIALGLDTL